MDITIYVIAEFNGELNPGPYEINAGSEDSMKEQVCYMANSLNEDTDYEGPELTPDMITSFEVSDWGDLEGYDQLQYNLEDLADYSGAHGLDILEAALACDVPLSDVDEAFSGEFSSDQDFALDMAEQLGVKLRGQSWPFSCIDWEHAAKELMYDYCEENGYYFRNL
jgi:hypothetical protein